MSGLEVSELLLSDVNKDNDRFRFDAEYFKKEYLENEDYLKLRPFIKLKDTGLQIIHPAEIIRTYVEEGVWFFRTQNLKPMEIDCNSNKVYISFEDASLLFKNIINIGDVLITRTGNVGDSSIYSMEEKAIASSHILIVRCSKLNHYYLATFLNTKYGKLQINKWKYGSLQPEIAPYYLRNIVIPSLSNDFQIHIQSIMENAENIRKESKTLYSQASDLLLSELGLKDFNPSNENISIKTLKESFLKTGRLDSEYYQIKYEEIESKIKSYIKGYDSLENICIIENNDFMPNDDTTYKYIELSDINNNGLIHNHTEKQGKLLPSRARRLIKENDVIVSSIEGSIDKTAIVTGDYNLALCSTGFYVIRSNMINSETLLVLFKSEVICNLIKRFCSGSILTSISEREFKTLPIPLIKEDVQSEIASYIQKSISYSKQAKKLLKEAVYSVEKAIENNVGGGYNVL